MMFTIETTDARTDRTGAGAGLGLPTAPLRREAPNQTRRNIDGVGLRPLIARDHRDPPLLELAQRLVADGVPWREASRRLEDAAAEDRDTLETSYLHQLEAMRHQPTGDHDAAAVLRSLERALASTPWPEESR